MHEFKVAAITFPEAVLSYAIEPKSRGDEDKISTAMQRLKEEDPSISYARDPQTHELLLSGPDQEEHAVPLPEARFYLSVAPYVDGTHDCFFHSLTTCRGEMSEEEIDVRIETADGEVLVDETRRTFDNGFVGFWLPRDVEATITLARGDERGSATVTTGDEDLTCLTTVRLA